jgi:hypothetical protein
LLTVRVDRVARRPKRSGKTYVAEVEGIPEKAITDVIVKNDPARSPRSNAKSPSRLEPRVKIAFDASPAPTPSRESSPPGEAGPLGSSVRH